MVKKILSAVALVFLCAGATAGPLPEFGVKGGLNFSSINLSDLDASPRTGYAAGLFVNLALPGLGLQGEALYTVKGFKQGSLLGVEEIEYREHYIQIPVLAKFSLPIPMVSPSFYLGPSVSIPMKGEYKTDRDWVEFEDDAESLIWSMILGLDLTLMDTLVIDLRYDWGLSSIRKASFGDVAVLDEEIKDRTITVMAGFRF